MGQPVVQFQIIAKNPEASAKFYAKLFDWKSNADNALGYRTLDSQNKRGISGGIWPAPPEGHALVQLFVEVSDVAGYVTKAKELGANVIIPPSKLPDGDEMAVILDPEGLSLGLVKPRG